MILHKWLGKWQRQAKYQSAVPQPYKASAFTSAEFDKLLLTLHPGRSCLGLQKLDPSLWDGSFWLPTRYSMLNPYMLCLAIPLFQYSAKSHNPFGYTWSESLQDFKPQDNVQVLVVYSLTTVQPANHGSQDVSLLVLILMQKTPPQSHNWH